MTIDISGSPADEQLPKQYSPFDTEAKWQKTWEETGVFVAQATSDREPYTIVIPPPNVTGSLHMGHAFEEAIIDVLVRFHRMKGRNTLWLPGTDHASIAVETLLEKQFKAEGTTRNALGREQYLQRAWKWKAESGGTITNQLRRLGVSVDWTRERFTMDAGLSTAVLDAFVKLHDDGLIHRGNYLVNWCPASQSAVSDLEVDNQEVKGHLWHFRYPLTDGSGYLVVATTRPETMLGDTAVAVNPNDERYQHLIGCTVTLPIMNREIPIIGDEYVDREFGTGCVKVTPAHDFNDFEMGQRHALLSINILNKDGTINEQGGEFAGRDRFQARKLVVAKLEELGCLEKIEDYVHAVPYSERGKVPVEPFLSTQWFVKIRPLADFALQAYDSQDAPHFVPERWGKVYRDWLVKLKDWCISRQLWWGHQIPAWYVVNATQGEITDATPYVVARSAREAGDRAIALYGEQYGPDLQLVQDPDVLDTWFSSGLWPFSTLGWPENTPDLQTFYPTSVLVTGFDIIFFWVARMTMMAGYFTRTMPFHTVYIHGLVRDENNKKMSKTSNNGIDPLLLIEKYGTDALRYALIREVIGAGQDIRMDFNRKTNESATVEAARNFANKLWNASRFVLMNLQGFQAPEVSHLESTSLESTSLESTSLEPTNLEPTNLELCDRWILSRFHRTALEANRQISGYGLGEGARAIYEFIWGDFCDYYIELVKPRLLGDDAASRLTARQVLVAVLEGTLRLLHPYMPHITEEIWQAVVRETQPASSGDSRYLATQAYPEGDTALVDEALEAQFVAIFEAIRVIRNLRAEAEIKPGLKIKAILQSENADERGQLQAGRAYIEHLGKVEDLAIAEILPEDLGQSIAGVFNTVQVVVPLAGMVDVDRFRQKLQRELGKLDGAIASLQGRLGNADYVQKASPEVVATARADLGAALQQQATLRDRLQQLQA